VELIRYGSRYNYSMKFKDFFLETKHRFGLGSLTIFDIDETLFHTTAKIKVVDKEGKPKELSNQEFNTFNPEQGEQLDFSEFKDAEKFNKESKPIPKMVNKMIAILGNVSKNPKSKVIILTARSDFDNKEVFLDTFRKHGINIDMVYVERAGNLQSNLPVAEKKNTIIRKYLDTNQFDKVRLYDDAQSNIEAFKSLASEYPQVDFFPYLVNKDGNPTSF
jgi:hypothetical protein